MPSRCLAAAGRCAFSAAGERSWCVGGERSWSRPVRSWCVGGERSWCAAGGRHRLALFCRLLEQVQEQRAVGVDRRDAFWGRQLALD